MTAISSPGQMSRLSSCAGRLAEADIEHIAEEIDSMGRTEKRELISRLTVRLLHLLKWRFQPGKRGPSWDASIRNQRDDISAQSRDCSSPDGEDATARHVQQLKMMIVLRVMKEIRRPAAADVL